MAHNEGSRFDQDLGLLSTLLGGGLDPMSGITMLQQAMADRRARQDQRKANLSSLIQAGVEGSATMTMPQMTEYLGAMGDALGMKDKQVAKAGEALGGFYPEEYGGASIMQALWDESDEADIQSLVQEAQGYEGFEDDPEGVLEFVKNKLKYDPAYGLSPEIVDNLVASDIERSVRANWSALGGKSENTEMSLEEATARAAGTYDENADYAAPSGGDPDDNIGWLPDFIEGPANFLTFNAVDNLASADDLGDIGQGIAGAIGGVGSLIAAPLRAAAGVGQLGKAAYGVGRIGSRASAARSALAATGDDALGGWAKARTLLGPRNIAARGLTNASERLAGLGGHMNTAMPALGRLGPAMGIPTAPSYVQWANGMVKPASHINGGKFMKAGEVPWYRSAVPFANPQPPVSPLAGRVAGHGLDAGLMALLFGNLFTPEQ